MPIFLSLLGIGRTIRAWTGVAFGWAARYPWQAACLALAVVAALGWHGNHKWHHATLVAQDALRAQQAAIIAGQKAAEAMDKARNARVATEQQRINDDVSTDYGARLADLRARYDRLRNANQGAAGGQQVPGLSPATSDPDAASGYQGFSLDQRFIASQQAEQLDVLITWVARQHAVDPNAVVGQ